MVNLSHRYNNECLLSDKSVPLQLGPTAYLDVMTSYHITPGSAANHERSEWFVRLHAFAKLHLVSLRIEIEEPLPCQDSPAQRSQILWPLAYCPGGDGFSPLLVLLSVR